MNTPGGLALVSNQLYFTDALNHRVRRINLDTGVITTFAGSGATNGAAATFGGGSYGGDGGSATSALLNTPIGLAADADYLYIGDAFNYRIRRVALRGPDTITTVAGTGTQGFSGDDGPASAAMLGKTAFLAVSPQGTLWIADQSNNRVREVDFAANKIRTVAGTGASGFSGDGRVPLLATFAGPVGIAFDSTGGVLVSDFNNHRIRRIHAASNTITTGAGSGSSGTEAGGFSGMEPWRRRRPSVCRLDSP